MGVNDSAYNIRINRADDRRHHRDQYAISLTAGNTRATGTVSFTVATPAVVTFTVAQTGSQDPVISWLAVAKRVDLGVAGRHRHVEDSSGVQ